MDGLDFMARLGKAAEEMKVPMTIEEALDIVDPSVILEPPEDADKAMAKEVKARRIVVKFVREKLKEKTEN